MIVTMLEFGKDSIGPAIEEDVDVFVTQQRGFRSRGFKGVYLSNQEKRIRRYHELIDEHIRKHLGEVLEAVFAGLLSLPGEHQSLNFGEVLGGVGREPLNLKPFSKGLLL